MTVLSLNPTDSKTTSSHEHLRASSNTSSSVVRRCRQVAQGGGFLEIRYRGVSEPPPPFFQNGLGGFLRGFFDASTPVVRNFFW